MMAVLSASLSSVRRGLHLSRVPQRNKQPALPNERTPKKPREQFRLRTGLIHRSFATGRWDYDHYVFPQPSSSASCRLPSVHRGAAGVVEFATPEIPPRADCTACRRWRADGEPAEKRDAAAEFLPRHPKVQRVVYPRLANFAQRELARRQMTAPDGAFAPACI